MLNKYSATGEGSSRVFRQAKEHLYNSPLYSLLQAKLLFFDNWIPSPLKIPPLTVDQASKTMSLYGHFASES